MVRSGLLVLAFSFSEVSLSYTQDPLQERLNAATANLALRQSYFDASGEPPLTLEQAFPHLAGAPLDEPSFLTARRRTLEAQRDACARERLQAGERVEQVRATCDAEDDAALLEERLLASLAVGLEIAPGLTAESIERARRPWREARERAARIERDDPDFADASRGALVASEAERRLLQYQSAALRTMAIPGDAALTRLVEADVSRASELVSDDAARDRLQRASPLVADELSLAIASALQGTRRTENVDAPEARASETATDLVGELRDAEITRHTAVLDDIRRDQEGYARLEAELAEARALTILDSGRNERLGEVSSGVNRLIRSIRSELEALVAARSTQTRQREELTDEAAAVFLHERDVHTVDEIDALMRLEKRVLALRRSVDPLGEPMTSQAFVEELVAELESAPLWLELAWRNDVRWLRTVPERATDVTAVGQLLELSFDLLLLAFVWIFLRRQATGWLRRAVTAAQTKEVTRYGFGRKSRHVTNRELEPVAVYAVDAAVAFVLYRLLLPRSELLALVALLWVGWALLHSIPAAIRLLLPLAGQALDPLEAESEPPAEVMALGESTSNWFLRWWVLSAVASFIAVPLLEADRLLQLVQATSWSVFFLLSIIALARWTPWIRHFIANLADQSKLTAWLARPGSKLQGIARSAVGGVYIMLRLVFWALVDRGWLSRSGTSIALSQLQLADAADELLSRDERERIRSTETVTIERSAELDKLQSAFDGWRRERRRGIVVVTGDNGMGKTVFLDQAAAMLANTASDVPMTKLELPARKRTDNLREQLSWLTEPLDITIPKNTNRTAFEKTIVEHVEASPPRIILVDDLHLLLRRTVGGFDVLEVARNVIQACADEHFWVVTLHRPAWTYVDGVSSAMKLAARERIELAPLDPDKLGDALVERTRRAGFEPAFRSLLKGRRPHAEAETLEDKARKLYWRIVSQASHGNPRVAGDFWLASLGAANGAADHERKQTRVYLFAGHGDDEIEGMSDEYLFLLTALVVHDGLKLQDLADVLNVTLSRVRVACQHLESLGIIEYARRRFLVTTHWQPAIVRVLDRRNFAHR